MSIKLRTVTDTTTTQLGAEGQVTISTANAPLTATEVDNNFVTLKQKIDEIEEDYDTTFNPNGTLKDGTITTASLSDGGVTSAKIKDRAVDWSDQRNILYLTDVSSDANKVDATLADYLANTGLTALPAGTVLAFKAALENKGSVTLTLRDKAGESEPTTLISLPILKQVDTNLIAGDMKLGGFYLVYYDGTTLQLVNSFQDPTVIVEENVSAVATFGPIETLVSGLSVNNPSEFSHNLDQAPTTFEAYLVCVATEHGYSTSDIVPLDSITGTITVTATGTGTPAAAAHTAVGIGAPIVVRATANDIVITKTSAGLKIPNATNGTAGDLTEDSWKIVVRGTYRNENTYSPSFVDRALDYPTRRASGGVTIGNYLYYFSTGAWKPSTTYGRLRKINLITNRVFNVCNASVVSGYNHLYIRYSSTDTYKAANGVIVSGQGGTGYAVDDILTITGGTQTTQATFKVTTVASGVVTAVTVENPGIYTALPDNAAGDGVATTGGTGGNDNAKISASWTLQYDNRLFWAASNGETNYIIPNGLDTAETAIKINTTAWDHSWWGYAVQEFQGNYFWGLRNREGAASTMHLYRWSTSASHAIYTSSAATYTLNMDNVKDVDGKYAWRAMEANGKAGESAHISTRHVQWNPVKKRLYVINDYNCVCHVLETTHPTLQSLWDAPQPPADSLTYIKTVGIPGGTVDETDTHYDGYWIDTDPATGEEKSITITRYGNPRGSVTRAAWREG